MEIPHLETRWDYRLRRESCLVNLYPHPTTLSKVRLLILCWILKRLIYIPVTKSQLELKFKYSRKNVVTITTALTFILFECEIPVMAPFLCLRFIFNWKFVFFIYLHFSIIGGTTKMDGGWKFWINFADNLVGNFDNIWIDRRKNIIEKCFPYFQALRGSYFRIGKNHIHFGWNTYRWMHIFRGSFPSSFLLCLWMLSYCSGRRYGYEFIHCSRHGKCAE